MSLESAVARALADLAGDRYDRGDAARVVPASPGLYAFYGDERAWAELGLSPVFDGQPLYIGKAEKSLNGRDVGTHFSTGKTGSSTVRRSLAALLVDRLGLVAVPRNRLRPDGSANYALDPESDVRLTAWMEDRLTLATWQKPTDVVLGDVETAVLVSLRPPLNLDKVGEPRERLREARRALAEASRVWAADTSAPAYSGE
ncbi:GIY-YIG nuclease family protein [Nocardioides sp. YIM 152588]|uniref:GIY-YIG nuclease family protein n=1 Tax=Nocardioides sp. YIM 152588 TaxID=3158259 RepID=UPI0032E45981